MEQYTDQFRAGFLFGFMGGAMIATGMYTVVISMIRVVRSIRGGK